MLTRTLNTQVQPETDPVLITACVAGHGADLGASEQAARELGELALAGIVIDDFSLGQPSLDEVFLALTDRPAESATTDPASTDPDGTDTATTKMEGAA